MFDQTSVNNRRLEVYASMVTAIVVFYQDALLRDRHAHATGGEGGCCNVVATPAFFRRTNVTPDLNRPGKTFPTMFFTVPKTICGLSVA